MTAAPQPSSPKCSSRKHSIFLRCLPGISAGVLLLVTVPASWQTPFLLLDRAQAQQKKNMDSSKEELADESTDDINDGASAEAPENAPESSAPQQKNQPKSPPSNTPRGRSGETPAAVEFKAPAKQLAEENETYRALESFAKVMSLLESNYVDPDHVSPEEMVDKAIRGITASLDPHTTYLPAKELREFTNDTTGKFGGIGVIILHTEGNLEIVEVVEDSPGERAGLKKGDIIYAVGEMVITKENMEDALNLLKGLPGSIVDLTIVKDDDKAEFDKLSPEKKKTEKHPKLTKLRIKRAVIRTPSVKHVKLSNGYLYLNVSVFQEETGEQADKLLRKYEAENGGRLDGLILDLRGNPGGLLDQAVRIADLFLDSGIIVSTIGRDTAKQEVEFATKRTTHPYMPIIVLVNEGTASASEIVAGALQDHERALILGTKTFGKGSVQSIIPLPNGAGLKMTIARYYTPKGRSIQAKGIVPDIPVTGRKWQEDAAPPAKDSRRESDLRGHIDAGDLSDRLTPAGFEVDIKKWPKEFQDDYQLRVAYTYLRGWARFDIHNRTKLTKPKPETPAKDAKKAPAPPAKDPKSKGTSGQAAPSESSVQAY